MIKTLLKTLLKKIIIIAHNVLDCLMADIINAILENDSRMFKEIFNDRIAIFILNNYKHKKAPKKKGC